MTRVVVLNERIVEVAHRPWWRFGFGAIDKRRAEVFQGRWLWKSTARRVDETTEGAIWIAMDAWWSQLLGSSARS